MRNRGNRVVFATPRAGSGTAREDLRKWRLSTPMDHFRAVRKKFDDAGISLFAYTVNFREDYTDPEVDSAFEQAKALGVNLIAASTQLTMAKRLVPFAEKHKINVAMHGHSNIKDPNEFATPESFAKPMPCRKNFRITSKIAHSPEPNLEPSNTIREPH